MPRLGHQPEAGYDVVLVRDNDWIQTGHRTDGTDWPAGTVITLKIGSLAIWAATINGPAVSWRVDKTEVNALIDQVQAAPGVVRAVISYVDGTGLDLTLTNGKTVTRA